VFRSSFQAGLNFAGHEERESDRLLDDTIRFLAENDFRKLLTMPLAPETVGATQQVLRMRAIKSR
jgi:hypothetical protein